MSNTISGSLVLQLQKKYLKIFSIKTQQKIDCNVNYRENLMPILLEGTHQGDTLKPGTHSNLWFWETESGSIVTQKMFHSNIKQIREVQIIQLDILDILNGQGQAIQTGPIPLVLVPGLCTGELPKGRG